MKRVYKFLLFLVGILSFGACNDTEKHRVEYGVPTIYDLSGTVKTAGDVAIEGIKIKFADCEATSDAEGIWSIADCSYGMSGSCSDLTTVENTDTRPCYVTAVDIDGPDNGAFYKVESVYVNPQLNEQTDIDIVLTEEE